MASPLHAQRPVSERTSSRTPDFSPYLDFDRAQWRRLRKSMPQVLTENEVIELRGIGENIDLEEVAEVYLPLSRLIHLQVKARQELTAATETFLGTSTGGVPGSHVPFIIGVAGSVAVGKSTTARLLQVLLQRWSTHPRVDLVTTDGFLYPAAELTRRGIMNRKGFPESYDQRSLLRFVTDVKSGKFEVRAPVYSHTAYDRVPGEFITVKQPDILIVEGLNVLQTGPTLMVSDLFDFSVYVDARTEDIEQWYIDRFLELRHTAFRRPGAHFSDYADMADERAMAVARELWQSINLPNLVENILPTRVRASLVLRKGGDHLVERVRMRKI
ncbi:type I pantothenate kinase [Corynebacterium pacaense]|uniref:type I pantothenate kinase n=1 Tax=Corynebacterium pacaense TaxID=1816684 RepID=UPI0009BC67E5|nr:type I pantothenate kinase [Corynebacterium pacaense]